LADITNGVHSPEASRWHWRPACISNLNYDEHRLTAASHVMWLQARSRRPHRHRNGFDIYISLASCHFTGMSNYNFCC
jgi:hypothetical protein